MLKKYLVLSIIASAAVPISPVQASYETYGHQRGFSNYNRTVNGQAWRAFTHAKQVKYARAHTLDKAPFPKSIEDKNIIKVNLGKLAWGAYDSNGKLVKWGDASGGQSFCSDIGKSCKTITGTYTFYRKQGSACKSNLFPVGKGGAPMPYCMHFTGGYALHGGNTPDFNASHGCVRVPVAEAQWLNQQFVTVGKTRISISY